MEKRTITTNRLVELLDAESKMETLEEGGVDNWSSYGDAMSDYEEISEDVDLLDTSYPVVEVLTEEELEEFLEDGYESDALGVVSSAISLGSVIAVTISWSLNSSVGWALVHGVFGWLYVLYYGLMLNR